MILLNFSHPLTPDHLAALVALSGQPVEQVIDLPAQFDPQQLFEPQLQALLAAAPLTPAAWQTAALLVNPPSLNFITALVLAELHGRMGYFPPVVWLWPVAGALPPLRSGRDSELAGCAVGPAEAGRFVSALSAAMTDCESADA